MKCKDCKYYNTFIAGFYVCGADEKKQMLITAPNKEMECFNESMYKSSRYEDILSAIDHLKAQIEADLKELDGDTTSEFAQILLRGHKHINVAIDVLEEKLTNIMLKYTE